MTEKALKNFKNSCLMNKKIPLFLKKISIFSPIFFGSHCERPRQLLNKQWSRTVLAPAAKACPSRMDAEGKKDQSGDKATPESNHYNDTRTEDIIHSDRQGNVNGRLPVSGPPLVRHGAALRF